MSELRKLRDELERLYPRALDLFRQHRSYSSGDINGESKSHNLFRAKDLLWRTICALSRVIVEQEALSPTLNAQDAEQKALSPKVVWSSRDYSPMGICTAEPKGSSVEYYKDQIVEMAVRFSKDEFLYSYLFHTVVKNYESALSASPDPEGSWEWVPKGWVIAPEEPTIAMINNVTELSVPLTDKGKYWYMLAARPPVPKKGERG